VEEKISGTISWKKRKIYQIINDAKAGDIIIVSELSRLGRSMLEIMEILSIISEKKLSLYSVKGDWHLNDSMQSKIIAMVFAMASEIERELISSRTKEALLANGSTQKFIANRYDTTEANLYNWLLKHKLKTKK